MNYILHAYALQDIGKRSNQEDSFFPPFIDPCHYDETDREWCFYDGSPHTDDRLFIVCDGMGGHDRGEVASRIVTQTMSSCLMRSASIEGAFNDNLLRHAVSEALDALAAKDDPNEVMKMGTTMTVLKFHADGATVGHIGDSRVYQFRPAQQSQPAKIMFHTEDHTVINEMLQSGQITMAQARNSGKKHILSRAMMSYQERVPEVEIHHITDIKRGDIFMLCSDGIYENMDNEALCQLLTDPNYSDVQRIQHLLHETIDNCDNHSAIIVRVEDIMNTPGSKSDDMALSPGTVLKSENYTYHIERVLGHGAFGITYLVNTSISMQGQLGTIRTGVKVALKEFCMDNDMKRVGSELQTTSHEERVRTFADKFRREATKLAMLSHPNIVRVLEVFEANNTYYYAMEYLPGGSLNEYVNKKGGLPEREAIGCIRQIGSALMYMHTNKILHLDVKPANIMREESTNTLKIIDFGLAKRYAPDGNPETSATLGSGTPGYAPLEQADEKAELDFSPELDVYAIGATYYKLLTGITPRTAIDVLNHGINTIPLVKKNVSQKSIDAIREAMQPTKAKRLKTVGAFIDMLPRVDDETIFKEKKSNNVLIGAIAALVVATVVIIGSIYMMRGNKTADKDIAATTDIVKDYNIEMIKVDGGTFTMGCANSTDADSDSDEGPQHMVELSSFSIGKYEVTQSLWNMVMDDAKVGKSKNADYPVFNVTYDEVMTFIERLNEKTGRHFRLPTEAEWEYAARGGSKSSGTRFSGSDSLASVAWHNENSSDHLHPVGRLKANELGIYDMSGNVWELCSDWYGDYSAEKSKDPRGPKTGDFHVMRGGCWQSTGHDCRTTYRQDESQQMAKPAVGFRLAE